MKSNLKIKSAVTLLSFALLGVLLPHTATAAINPGSKCNIYGQKKMSQGKSYKCIKSGKSLVWNKGILVIVPTPTPSSTQIVVTEPVQVPAGLWQETQFKILAEFKKLKPTRIQELNFVYSPNVDKAMAKQLQDSYQEPITYLSNLYVNPVTVTVLVMSENDKDWWLTRFNELSPNMDNSWWGKGCDVTSRIHCGYGSSPNPDNTFHFGHIIGSAVKWEGKDYMVAYHEAIHVYQIGLMGNRMNALPFWFAEGQANYLGYTFSNRFVDSKMQRNPQIRGMFNLDNAQKYDDNEWAQWLAKIDSDSSYTFYNRLGYTLGELILESLYNQYDFRKIHEWMVTIKNGSDYKTGFKTIFGQDYDSWLRDTAAPYLNSQI